MYGALQPLLLMCCFSIQSSSTFQSVEHGCKGLFRRFNNSTVVTLNQSEFPVLFRLYFHSHRQQSFSHRFIFHTSNMDIRRSSSNRCNIWANIHKACNELVHQHQLQNQHGVQQLVLAQLQRLSSCGHTKNKRGDIHEYSSNRCIQQASIHEFRTMQEHQHQHWNQHEVQHQLLSFYVRTEHMGGYSSIQCIQQAILRR